jgi:RNA 2',3'-cyclic 3'-phosphodiesterase
MLNAICKLGFMKLAYNPGDSLNEKILPMRLFLALDLPEIIKEKLHSLKDTRLNGARWTSPEQWHITLHFIGESEEEPVREALEKVKAASFSLQLRGVGTFPERGKPNVLWLGIIAPPALKTLHQATGEALKTTGFAPENRPYSPHLTLARFKETKPDREALDNYRQQHASFETESFSIRHFSLYQSDLTQSGAVYTVRANFDLA